MAAAKIIFKFWGVRGSIPTPGPTTVEYGGNTSCVEVRADGQIIILDAGTGLRLLGRELVAEFENQPQNQLRILGFEGSRRGLDNVLTGQMESPFFPIGLREVPANVRIEEIKDFEFNVGPVRVGACLANHPGTCVGYRLFASEGSIAFFPDNELPREKLGSVTDKMMTDFLHGVDVLIMDSQYDASEYKEHVGWGHGCLDEVVALALRAEVKRLFLFHHDPNHDDAKISQMVDHARRLVTGAKGALQVEA